ncbi:MAG: signal peptidase II [Magnetococcus sp. DMHC-6]
MNNRTFKILSPRYLGPGIAVLVIFFDQVSKFWMTNVLQKGEITLLPGFFDLTLVHNFGAAFGLFTNLPPFWRESILIGVAAVATFFIIWLLRQTDRIWMSMALGLVLGGAVGNLVDRLRLGWVVDFIHLHWYDLSWPVFNLADCAITLGIGMLLWDNFKNS